jgi:hypothetical protein
MDTVGLNQVHIDATATPALPVYLVHDEDEAANGGAAPLPNIAVVARRQIAHDAGVEADEEEEEVRAHDTPAWLSVRRGVEASGRPAAGEMPTVVAPRAWGSLGEGQLRATSGPSDHRAEESKCCIDRMSS